MKKFFADPKILFTFLMGISILAIAAGTYLGVALGMQVQAAVTVLSAVGILLWAEAWGVFLIMCRRLHKGDAAFTPATGKTLKVICWCMAGLAGVTFASALIGLNRPNTAAPLIGLALLPGVFLGAAVAANILRELLQYAMSIEEKQEGVV